MFWVEYYCPRQAPYWQRRVSPLSDFNRAVMEAQMMKPGGMGQARVLNQYGQVVYTC